MDTKGNNSTRILASRPAEAYQRWLWRNRARAFTIIELLAATVIAALLMGGVLIIVAQLAGDSQRLTKEEISLDAEPLVELLRRDLAHAGALVVQPSGNGFVVEGYSALDPQTLRASGLAARVEYRLLQTQAGSWLVRQQTSLDASPSETSPGSHSWIEYVCPAVKRLYVWPELPAGQGAAALSGHANAPRSVESANNTAIFDRLRLQIEWTEPNRAPLLRELVLR